MMACVDTSKRRAFWLGRGSAFAICAALVMIVAVGCGGQVGDTCGDGHPECADGLVCYHAGGAPYTCQHPMPAGEPCEGDVCQEHLVCTCAPDTWFRERPVCHERVCVVRGGRGDACSSTRMCEDELACNAATIPYQCQLPAGLGEPCGEKSGLVHDQCQDHLICTTALEQPECRPPGVAGDPCSNDIECSAGHICTFNEGSGHCSSPGEAEALRQ